MASDVHNPDKSNNDQFKNSNSSLPLVGEKIMKWRISTQDKYLVGDEQVEARGNIKRNHSSAKAAGIDPKDTKKAIDHLQAKRRKFEGSSSNRSKRMTSGSFLLPDILTTSSSLARYSVQDPILSNSRNSDERVYTNIRSSKIKNVEDVSPNLKKGNAIGKNEIINSHTENSKLNQNYPKNIEFNTSKGKKIELDDESMQIINIALNLSKNRRVASSQAILRPSILNGNVENISDTSLQSLTKQQRRATRKSSSKFDGPKRALSLSSQANENATNRLPSIILNSHSEQTFKYNFSPSTLARSKKAKIYFELMAQYRRLLNFVPPLRTCSDRSEKAKNSISALLDNHENLESSSSQIRTRHTNHLGRDYNPLQYIRNRRLRARISKTINGEAEGFGDVENVSVWIDSVAKYVSSGEYQDRINFSLPKFPLQTYEKSGSNFPVRDNSDKHQESSTKVKRPRIDWIVNPCDLIADLYWVEQGENKKLIEDRFGNTIFDEEIESRKPIIHDNKKKDKDKKISPEINQQGSRLDLSIETEMPVIKSSKPELHEAAYDSTHKSIQGFHNFKNAVYIDHSPNRREKHQAKSQIRSGSSSQSLSSSKGSGHRKYRHSAKHKKVYPVLSSEKQVNKLTFKKDSRVDDSFYEAGLGRDSYESQMLYMNSHPEYQNQKIPNNAWQNYESKIKLNHNFMLGKEIARVRTLLISSGIKAKEIKRRAEIKKDLTADENSSYVDVAALTQRPLARVSKIQKHKLAVQIISEDINRSLYVWNTTSEMLIRKTIKSLKHRIISLRTEITENLTPLTRLAADEADSLSQNLITDHRLAVTQIADQITQLKRRRKARFRWLGRGWWIMLEWVLIGIMWWVWFIVVITRIVLGTAKIVIGAIKWLVWL
ncbi:hypothetical protein HI914_04738 [Erysiphe necator]|nr:hypothetical protein HI914_04738 [Erysiphe necator]